MLDSFLKTFNLSLNTLIAYMPSLIGGLACFVISIFIANFLSKISNGFALKKTKDGLIASFIGKIVWSVIFILGTVLALGILGLGTISNKILAGAGITTFIVGFALKDIGENFLSGLILAFSRPYKVGTLIECEDVKGVVRNMTLRQTTIEADDGKIILVPNSMIIKNPLLRYKTADNLRQEFHLNIDQKNSREIIDLIKTTVHSFDNVLQTPEKPVKVVAGSLSGDKINVQVIFWFDTKKFKGSFSETRSEIMLTVIEKLREREYTFSG
ncbi:MAG: mechanosensitive ion channel family protein [Bacteroidota bacterium]|jgi:small-conductance mechanosensitive channel|nr:mechanosensitive ion channel family protein [Bacteroidota bacterium]